MRWKTSLIINLMCRGRRGMNSSGKVMIKVKTLMNATKISIPRVQSLITGNRETRPIYIVLNLVLLKPISNQRSIQLPPKRSTVKLPQEERSSLAYPNSKSKAP